MASAVPESTKKSPKYAGNVFQGGESHEQTFNIQSYVNLNRFILQNEDLIQCAYTNYKINQPSTSNCSVGRREKFQSHLNHGAGRIVNHVETFYMQKPEKSVEGKPYSRNTVKANSFRADRIFFWFTKHKRPISSEDLEVLYAANQLGLNALESFSNLACFNTILYFEKRGRENQREMKPGDLYLKTTTSWLKYFISSKRATKNQSTFKRYRFYTFCV